MITRFAPSPTGHLHMGHAMSARCGFDAARARGGRFLLRIEDIDRSRCRPELERDLLEDLRFLGLAWDDFRADEPVRRQSDHLDTYAARLAELDALGVLYPCFCTRAEIQQAASAPHDLPPPPVAAGLPATAAVPPPDPALIGVRYPGTCRALPRAEADARIAAGRGYALRLDIARACERVRAADPASWPLRWTDRRAGEIPCQPELLGDVVLGRKEIRTSYHLAVTIDDDLQGVTLVTRGEDLFHATHIHRLLQALLGLRTPVYEHHGLIADTSGQRLAKRHGAPSIRSLRSAGQSAAALWRSIGLDPI